MVRVSNSARMQLDALGSRHAPCAMLLAAFRSHIHRAELSASTAGAPDCSRPALRRLYTHLAWRTKADRSYIRPTQPARGRGGRSGTTSGRNSPALIRDQGTRASSTPAPSKSERPTGSTIDALKLFLLSRYTADARMLNLENMAEDPVLREHNLLSPGQKGAPSNMAGAMWKLSAEMFPNVRDGDSSQ